MGYGVYFWAYEKLVQREIALSGIRREQISPGSAILYGAAAGYVVSDRSRQMRAQTADCGALTALGCDISPRHDQVTDANGRVFPIRWPKVPICGALRSHRVENRGHQCVYERTRAHVDSVCSTRLGPFFLMVADALHRSPFANGATFLGFEMASRLLSSI
jgi:solute carrier family 25 (mitochondrial carnitine/acylcarnitine transporter), member 20/29